MAHRAKRIAFESYFALYKIDNIPIKNPRSAIPNPKSEASGQMILNGLIYPK
jgi:hypothetical protein